MDIVTIDNKKQGKILREKTAEFNFEKYSKKERAKLVRGMRAQMKSAAGIGLAANQIGLNLRVFVAEANHKFYAVFNPEIIKMSDETAESDEGCLSVPGKYGLTKRAEKVTLTGFDQNGKKIKIKAWGLLARIFQHEVDHLNGKLFIDTAKTLHEVEQTRE